MKEKIIDNIKYLYENDTIYDIQFISQDVQNNTIITIPGFIDDVEITTIDTYIEDNSQRSEFSIFSDKFYFKKLIISDNITDVRPSSFYYLDCDEVVWSKNCKMIPRSCFAYSQIKKIENIDHVEWIEMSSFYDCSKLRKFVWPSNCTIIPQHCFYHNTYLEKIENISHVTYIGHSSFYECLSLKTFTWPENCTIIPENCFSHCFNLETINNIEHVTEIREDSFRCCESLKKIKLVDVTDIYVNSFIHTNLTLDLSHTSLFDINKKIIEKMGIEKGKIILPYFYDEKEIIL